jgi:hypothetical protein
VLHSKGGEFWFGKSQGAMVSGRPGLVLKLGSTLGLFGRGGRFCSAGPEFVFGTGGGGI